MYKRQAEEFRALDWEGRMDWRFVEGEKRYQERFAETLLATHADLAARKKTPDAPNNKNEERHRLCEKMMQEGSASADITLRTSIRMSDEAFAAALEKARAEGRDTVHVRAWLALPAACPSQSHITLDAFTETPGHIAAEDAPQRTVYWEADLAENRTFGAEYSYRETAVYAAVGLTGFAMACVFATFYAVATKAVPEKANEVAGLMILAISAGAVSGPVCGAIVRWSGDAHWGMLFVALCVGYMLWASFKLKIKQ